MVSEDIKRVIEIIDQRITSLQQIRKMLLNEFGIGNDTILMQKEPQVSLFGVGEKETRKDSIKTLLAKEGPLPIREIMRKTGFPRGTITTVLSDKRLFVNKEGKWYLLSKAEEIKEAPYRADDRRT